MGYLSELHVGRAGEYLVAADLLRRGLDVVMAEQGSAYDLIADRSGSMLKVQVKSTKSPVNMPAEGRQAYRFNLPSRGRRGTGRYDGLVDLFALVGLDGGHIAYVPSKDMVKTLFLASEDMRGSHICEIKSARNEEIRRCIAAGKSYAKIALQFGVTEALVSKVNTGRAKVGRSVTYFSDLPFPL